MKNSVANISSINSQLPILARLSWLIDNLWLKVNELTPQGDFEVERFDLEIPQLWKIKGFFSKQTQLTVEDVSQKIVDIFPAQLETPQLYKVDDDTIRVIFRAGYPQEALGSHRELAKQIFTVTEEEKNAIVEQIPNYQDINGVMALVVSFIEHKASHVLSGDVQELIQDIIPSSKLMNDPIFKLVPQHTSSVFAQASRNIVRFSYSLYFLEQHLWELGYCFDDKELFKRLYYILIPEAFFPVMSSKHHYEYAASQDPDLCNPNLLDWEIWEQIERDYTHAKWLDKPRICPALSIEVFTHGKEFLFSVFEEAKRREISGWKLHVNHGLDTILDFHQYLDISSDLLDSHPAVKKIQQ